jgi:Putative amidoligase enzyme
MNVNIGYELEICTPLNDTKIRKFMRSKNMKVKDGIAANHMGPYDSWGIAIDGSIMPAKTTHYKYELISPVMPLDESLEVLKIMFDWLKDTEGYTNTSTGFHVGVSIDDKKLMNKLDPLKLIVLLEEDMILDMFNRKKSHWCYPIKATVLRTVKDQIQRLSVEDRHNPNLPNNIEELIRKNIPKSKQYTANLFKLPKYIEFRCMGDNYSSKYQECKDTILHYAECVKAACDEELHSDIYEERLDLFLKKLYKQNPKLRTMLEHNTQLLQEALNKDKQRRAWRVGSRTTEKNNIEVLFDLDQLRNELIPKD